MGPSSCGALLAWQPTHPQRKSPALLLQAGIFVVSVGVLDYQKSLWNYFTVSNGQCMQNATTFPSQGLYTGRNTTLLSTCRPRPQEEEEEEGKKKKEDPDKDPDAPDKVEPSPEE